MAEAQRVPQEMVGLVVMTLTEEEAQFLADVLSYISGDPKHSRRKHAEALFAALEDVGIHLTPNVTDFADVSFQIRTLDPEPSRMECGCA